MPTADRDVAWCVCAADKFTKRCNVAGSEPRHRYHVKTPVLCVSILFHRGPTAVGYASAGYN